jgi:23S rRNA (cytidine1920-2'-O)/16S rRNA (cytidine1409-2'-O)-methyltransferase
MAHRGRQPFIAITSVLRSRFPDVDDHARLIAEHRVVVDGRIATNPNGRVRRDASIRLLPRTSLRGDRKLSAALEVLSLDIAGHVVVDVGAAAGGFTTAALRAGARRVYAVDTGYGQLRGSLRLDDRVVNLERTNVSTLDVNVVPDVVDLVTMDLSYTKIADAVTALDALRIARTARLLALVKPTFELARTTVVLDRHGVAAAIEAAVRSVEHAGWHGEAITLPAITGRHGAIEAFIVATRAAALS